MKGMLNKKTLTLVFLLLLLPLLVGCLPLKNQSPIITSTPITLAEVNELYTYEVEATDPDGDSLTYSLDVKPAGMTINSATGLIEWTPTAEGDYDVVVKVSDGTLDITQSFTIVAIEEEEPGWTPTPPITPPAPPFNHAPTITSIPGDTAIVGVKYTYTIKATDPEGDAITYYLVSEHTGMTFDGIATISWTPTVEGSYSVIVGASDGKKAITQSFTITVKAVELTEIKVSPDIMTLLKGDSQQLTVTAYYNNGSTTDVTSNCIYDCEDTIAIIDVGGLVTAICPGIVNITIVYTPDGHVFTDTAEVTVKITIVIDGVFSPGEWDCATEILIAESMGTVRVLATTDYLYVAFVVDDSTDPREDVTSPGLSDKFAVNINPTDGGSWGFPYDILFQISASTGPFSNGNINSGDIDGWKSDLRIYDVQQLVLPVDLETVTLYGGGTGTCEWKVPLAAMTLSPGDVIKVGGAADIENKSYKYPVGLLWDVESTYVDIVVY